METVLSGLGVIRKGDTMFSVDLNDAYFQILIPSVIMTLLLHCFEWEGFPVQCIVFWHFHSSSGLHEEDVPGVGVVSQEGDSSALLPG